MTSNLILFGAGTIGRMVARELTAGGNKPFCFVDNDEKKWGTAVEGIIVKSPQTAAFDHIDAIWIATVLRTPYREELEEQIGEMGVQTLPLGDVLSWHREPIESAVINELILLSADQESCAELWDQYKFRIHNDLSRQRPYRDIANVYFESFITPRSDEHFVDCGAADGDTIREFASRWTSFSRVTAFEPDPANFARLADNFFPFDHRFHQSAVSDHAGREYFSATGDQTSHLSKGGNREVNLVTLDDTLSLPPTFIKMDIEGAELEALWGARATIRAHSPVLAICAYHTGDHLWQIPLLIHAINPRYRLYLRRYLEASWELIWYAVPPERVR